MQKIPTFEECLYVCKENGAFSHSVQKIHDREVHSFKYNFQTRFSDQYQPFLDKGINALALRGITFIDGELVALPFDKFFNIGECNLTKNLDFTKIKYITEKKDGSLINFFHVDEHIEVKTMKSLYSDVAISAREYVKNRSDIIEFVSELLGQSLSPMFEYVGKHRIVIRYNTEDLIFLGARSMINGEVFYPNMRN